MRHAQKIRTAVASLLVITAGCDQRTPGNFLADSAEPSENAQTSASNAAPAAEPAMAAVSRADIEAELDPGAGCSLVEDGRNLLVAVEGDAIAKPNGTTLHFQFEGGLVEGDALQLFEGGAFTGHGITITVDPAETEGQQIEELIVKPANVTVARDTRRPETLAAEWQCGS